MSDRLIRQGLSADAVSPDGLYVVDGGHGDEIQRAIDISVIGAAGAGAATFQPVLPSRQPENGEPGSTEESLERRQALAAAWDEWLEHRFEAHLAGPFCRVHEAAGRMRLGEIQRADADIDKALSEDERSRSRSAARAFREGREAIRHMPQRVRLEQAIDRAEAPGHVTTLFAMQAGLFHLPRLAALISYAYFEWLGGVGTVGWRGPTVVSAFEAAHPQTFASVRRVLRREIAGEDDGVSSIFGID